MEPLTGVENAALVEGVKFLYQQAAEILSAWRARRQDRQAPPPKAIESPAAVSVEHPQPLPDPASPEMADALQELKDLVEPVKDGEVSLEAVAARQSVARLRELLEVIVASPITFAGERPRAVDVSDVDVVVQRVAGQVRGVHADLAGLQCPASIRAVRVHGSDVDSGGEVTGVHLALNVPVA
jgi:hypothetical protein